jgi:predicted homoserine dehydrogenase-like protein
LRHELHTTRDRAHSSKKEKSLQENIRVAIIGGGRTGTPLLEEMLKYSYIHVVGVADLNPAASGIKIAAEKGIFTTSDPMTLVRKGEDIDILIEVSGDTSLKTAIKEYFELSGNKKTVIMHDLIARLFISVCTQQNLLIPTMHPNDIGIGN